MLGFYYPKVLEHPLIYKSKIVKTINLSIKLRKNLPLAISIKSRFLYY